MDLRPWEKSWNCQGRVWYENFQRTQEFRIWEEVEQAKDPQKEQSEGIKMTTKVFLSPKPRGESVSRRKTWLIVLNAAKRSRPMKAGTSQWIKQESYWWPQQEQFLQAGEVGSQNGKKKEESCINKRRAGKSLRDVWNEGKFCLLGFIGNEGFQHIFEC